MFDEKVSFKKIFADMTDDIATAIVLSAIVKYYTDNLEFPVEKENKFWITKSADEWWEEYRIHADEVSKALVNLGLAGLISSRFFTIKGNVTKCYYLNMGKFLEVLKESERRCQRTYNLFEE